MPDRRGAPPRAPPGGVMPAPPPRAGGRLRGAGGGLTRRGGAPPGARDANPFLPAPAPRTADGKPDLSGLWTKISPKYSRNIAADLDPADIQPWARALVQERTENLEKD